MGTTTESSISDQLRSLIRLQYIDSKIDRLKKLRGDLPEEIRDPKIEEKLTASRKRGWGLKIIRGLMDEVSIDSGPDGTTVRMSKFV